MNERDWPPLSLHELEASDRDAQPKADELLCASGCLLMNFQKHVMAAGGWAFRKQAAFQEWFLLFAVEQPVFRHMWASCVSVPGLVLLLHYRWCRSVPAWRLAALPCSCSPALRWPEALGNWALKKLKPTPTLVQAEELPSNSTKRYGCTSNSHCSQCFSSCSVPRKWFTGSGP